MLRISGLRDDDEPTHSQNAFRPAMEQLETRESPAIISAPDLYFVRSGRVIARQNLPPYPNKGLSNPFSKRGVLGNDYDDTLGAAPNQKYLIGLSANLISGPVDVATGQPITTPFSFNQAGPGSFAFRAPRNFNGNAQFRYQAYNAAGTLGGVTTVNITITGPIRRVAVGAGEGGSPRVDVFDSSTKTALFSFYAYDQNFTGGVRVATGDFNGDNVDDIVTVPGAGGAPNLRIFDGTNGKLIESFYALDPNFTGGLYVATGDLNADDQDDIVVSAERGGGPRVTVLDGANYQRLADFYAYDSDFTGGVRVAIGDFSGAATSTGGTGQMSLLTAPGYGGAPNVRQFDFDASGNMALTRSFFAGNDTDTRGLYLTAGDYNGDYTDDIAVGSGAGNAEVRVYSGTDLGLYFSRNYGEQQQLLSSGSGLTPNSGAAQSSVTLGLVQGPGATPVALPDTGVPAPGGTFQGFTGGARVGTTYANRDDNADLIVATGPNAIPEVTVLGGGGGGGGLFNTVMADFTLYGGKFYGGMFPTGHQ